MSINSLYIILFQKTSDDGVEDEYVTLHHDEALYKLNFKLFEVSIRNISCFQVVCIMLKVNVPTLSIVIYFAKTSLQRLILHAN